MIVCGHTLFMNLNMRCNIACIELFNIGLTDKCVFA